MKMKTVFFMLIVSMFLIVSATVRTQSKPYKTAPAPKIKVTVNGKIIDYVVGLKEWNGAEYYSEDTFKTILKEGSGFEIPYIEIGKTAVISFMSYPPSQLTISDVLIDKNGNQIYSDKEIMNIPAELKDGKCSFEIKKNMASALSSTYVENKTDIRGFSVIASWGQNKCEYAFIIRTDAF